MTHAIGPDGLHQQATDLTARAADTPRPVVSILSDLNPGRVRLSPTSAPPTARWKWALPPVLLALVGGGFLLGRQAPGPTHPPPAPAPAPDSIRSAPPSAEAPPALTTVPASADGGAIIREPSPPPPGIQAPEATPSPQANVAPPPPRPTLRQQASPPRPTVAPQPKPATAPPGPAAERDVDIITAIVR